MTDIPVAPRRPRSLYVFIAWTVVLAFNTGLILWDITGPLLTQYGSPETLLGWLGLALAFAAPFAFGASAYGLWEMRPWGRLLFLVITTLFFGFNLVGVWLPGGLLLDADRYTPAQVRNAQLLASARYGLALVIPWIYFNLSWIKERFSAPN